MNYQERILHLGKTRNSSTSRQKNKDFHKKTQSVIVPRPHSPRSITKQQHRYVMTHDGVFKTNVLKERQGNIRRQAPDNSAYLSNTDSCKFYPGIPKGKQLYHSQKQIQLLQKNQVLQRRISQLHRQNQTTVFNLRQQNMRLIQENNFLRLEISRIQNVKNTIISQLKQQLLNKIHIPQTLPLCQTLFFPKNNSSPTQNQPPPAINSSSSYSSQHNISIDDIIMNRQAKSEVKEVLDCQDKSNNKKNLEQLKEENMKYQQQIEKLIEGCLEIDVKCKKLEKENVQLKKRVWELEDKVKNMCQKQDINTIISNTSLKYEQILKQKTLQFNKINEKRTAQIKDYRAQKYNFLEIIQQKQNKIQQLQKILKSQNPSTLLKQDKNIQTININEECKKCRQLTKAVIKLNQRLYTGQDK